MTKTSTIIDEFNGKSKRKRATYQLIVESSGKYCIKRDNVTLLIYPEEEKAKRGFRTLRERRANEQNN